MILSYKKFGLRFILSVSATLLFGFLCSQSPMYADPIPKGWQASNMKASGCSGLDGRGGAFKMAIRQVTDLCAREFSHFGTAA
jgi:hypothetical protein